MMLSSPAWAGFLDRLYTKIIYNDINLGIDPTGPRITAIVELTVDLGGKDVGLTNLETTSLPLWSELTFKAKLASHDPYPDEWLALHRRHVRFNFYDSTGTLVYTERDNTNAHGLAKIKLPAGKLSGLTYLEVVYEGNQGSKSNRNGSGKLYPCREVVAIVSRGTIWAGRNDPIPPPPLPMLQTQAAPHYARIMPPRHITR